MEQLLELHLPSLRFVKSILKTVPDTKQQKLFLKRLTKGLNDPTFYNTSYISDLGLRRTDEPTKYFIYNACLHVKENGLDSLLTIGDSDSTIRSLCSLFDLETTNERYDFSTQFIFPNSQQPNLINEVVKYYADVLGNWSDADAMAQQIGSFTHRFPQNPHTALLFSNCGNLLAQVGNPQCRELYQKAYFLHDDPYQKFTTIFRIAVSEIKRLGDPTKIDPSLKEAKLEADRFGESTNNDNNASFCKALIKNLEALYLLKNKKMIEAETTILAAWETVSNMDVGTLDIDIDIANRYRVQIIENLALFHGVSQQWDSSLSVFEEAVEFSRRVHTDSLAETLSMLGYAYIRTGQAKKAVKALVEAERIRSKNVGILKTQEVRKMLAVAYSDLGDSQQTKFWMDKWQKEKHEIAI